MENINEQQLTIFDELCEEVKITKPIRLIELFAGYGSQAMALERLETDFAHHKVIEFDRFAVNSYNAVHDTDFKVTDIRDIHAEDLEVTDTDKYCYIMTYSFPCTDLSVAGKMKGMKKGSGTRSGLLWEVERLLKEMDEKPQVLLMENVPQVHGKKNKEDFQSWISFLESDGYRNYWQDLNAKDFGVPQNRQRCFMVSLLGNYTYHFPKPKDDTSIKISDLLENTVEEKYYLHSDKAKKLIEQLIVRNVLTEQSEGKKCVDGTINNPREKEIANCITARDDCGVSNQQSTGNMVVEKIRIKQATKKGYIECENGGVFDSSYPTSDKRRGRVQHGGLVTPTITTSGDHIMRIEKIPKINVVGTMDNTLDHTFESANRVYSTEGIAPTVHTCAGGGTEIKVLTDEYNIRKLTPREFGRLMGVADEDITKMEKVNSNSQLYKQFGNSIVVDVLCAIFKQLNIEHEKEN